MKPLAILVADDADEVRVVVQNALEKAGHRVVCAATGSETLKLLKRQPFDLLVTDIIMPDGDGLSVIMGIKQTHLSVRILAISGGGKHFKADTCTHIAEKLGAHAALFKPFTPQMLYAAIEQAMAPVVATTPPLH